MIKAYHHGELREALISAGTTVLEETGNTDISLREAARRAGVSPSATYRHFASKEALLTAIAGRGFSDLKQRFTKAKGSLAGFGYAYVDFARDRPAMFRLMFGGALLVGTLSEDRRKVGNGAYSALIDAVAQSSHLPADDPEVQRRAVKAWSLVHGYAMLLLDDRLPDAAKSERFLAEMLIGN